MGRRDALDARSRASARCRSRRASRTTRCSPPRRASARRSRCSRPSRDMDARRRAMLDVAFDSVVTMDDSGVVVLGQPRRGAPVRLLGGGDGRARGRGPDRPAVAARRPPRRDRALPADGARPGGRAPGGADRDARRPERVPGRAGRDAARRSPASRLLRLPARPDRRATSPRRRCTGWPTSRRRCGGSRRRSPPSTSPSRLFELVSEEVGRLFEAQTAHMFRFDSDGARRHDRRRLGAAGRARAAGRDADAAGRRHGGDARLAHRPRRADGQLRGRRGRAGGDDARATACRPSSPRRSSSAAACGAP